jgi:hypothetical protein
MRKKFNTLNWLKKHNQTTRLNKKRLNSLMTFTLMWNLFEFNYFNEENRLTPTSLKRLALSMREAIIPDKYLKFIQHFRNRYIEDIEEGKNKFDNLQLNNIDKDFVFTTLINCSPKENIITALFLISHRFRNNLFHGRKEPITLHLYDQQFNIINEFLSTFIDDTLNDRSDK